MSEYRIVRDYPQQPSTVWRALTDPQVVPRWSWQGRGGTPVGFAATVGTEFKYVAKPLPGWDGIVHCKVLQANAPTLLQYTWRGTDDDAVTTVTCHLEAIATGTRLTWEHTGFTGIGGFMMSTLLASVRRKMLTKGLPEVLGGL